LQEVQGSSFDFVRRYKCGSSSRTGASILFVERHNLLAPIRFVWNATRGHRLAPWRSEYLRWRVETYSGQKAETLTAKKVLSFVWASRWELLSFLAWTDRLDREVHTRT
jgi:hypothetical protein